MSRSNQNPLNKQLQIGGRIIAPLSNFRVRYEEVKYLQSSSPYYANEFGQLMDVDFYSPDNIFEHGGTVFMTALKHAVDSKNNSELCAHVASMMCMVTPSLEGSLTNVLEDKSIRIQKVKLPSQAEKNHVNMSSDYPKDRPSVLIVFGCCILLLFEDISITPQNYSNLMSNRIREMRSKVGSDPGNPMGNPFPLKKAEAIRSMLGSSTELKAEVISVLLKLSGRGNSIGSLVRYLMDILSWSGLHEFTFIHEELLLRKSPVFLDPRLKLELANLNESFQAICSHKVPQFFRYLGSKEELYKLERNRFPIIMAVVEALMRRTKNSETDQNFVSTMPQLDIVVEELVALHLDYIANERAANVTQTYELSVLD